MSAQKTKAAGHLAAIFTMLIWGTTFISTKVLLEDTGAAVCGRLYFPVDYPPGSFESRKPETGRDHDRGRYYGDRYLLSYGKHCPDFDTGIEYQRYCIDRPYFYRYSGPLFPGRGENEEEYRSGICVCNGRHLSDHIPERGDSRVKSTGRFPWCGSGSHLGSIFHLFQKNSRFWI